MVMVLFMVLLAVFTVDLVAIVCVTCLSVVLASAPVLQRERTDEDAQPGNPLLLVVGCDGWNYVLRLNL